MTMRDQIEEHGPAIVDALRGLAKQYGEDALELAWAKFMARRKRKTKNAISDAADVARERVKAGV